MEFCSIMDGVNTGLTAGVFLIVAGIVLIIATSLRPNGIEVVQDSLVITGNYHYSVKLRDIRSVEKWDSLPKIKLRTNGIGWPNINVGHFILKDIGKCRLYVNKKYPPYVHIVTNGGEHIVFNTKDPKNTEILFDSISQTVANSSVRMPKAG